MWLSLVGYVVAYFLMTIFLTSYERVPTKNEIAYKSISVAFIKNMGNELHTKSKGNNEKLTILLYRPFACYRIFTR
jgi:hypothetical protein